MNNIINKFLFAGRKVMSEMHLIQPEFTYSVRGLFTETKQKIQKFKAAGDSRYVYRNELDKTCFQHDMTFGDFKDLSKKKKRFLVKYYVMRGSKLLVSQSMMDINVDWHQWSTNLLIRRLEITLVAQEQESLRTRN